jgi:hypothetical protein
MNFITMITQTTYTIATILQPHRTKNSRVNVVKKFKLNIDFFQKKKV